MNNESLKSGISREKITDFLTNYGSIVGMVLVLIIFQLINNKFFNPENILGVFNTSTFLIIMSLAMMMVMSVRGIDLSIAQVADASGVVAAMLIISGQPFWVAILAGVAVGLIIGFINSLIISYLGVPAIIGTLGMMFIVRSVELTLTNGAQPQILFTLPAAKVKSFFFIGQGSIGPVPMLMIITIIIIVVIYFVKERSVLGRHMDSIHGNVRSAYLSSINIRKVFGSTFIISSLLAAVAGVMIVSRSGNAVPRGVESYLTDCFVAVFIGTLLSRGKKFNVIGTVVGALFVGFLSNFFTLMGMGSAYKNIFNGIFILFAVALSVLQKRKQ